MIKKNVSGCEYFNVPANNISIWCTSCRGTIFTWGADSEQIKLLDIPSRDSKTNNFQTRRPELRAKANVNKKECIEAMPLHVQSVQLKLLQNKRIGVMDLREETIKTEGRKPLLDRSFFLASIDVTEFQTRTRIQA
jgi:hypothetical protein